MQRTATAIVMAALLASGTAQGFDAASVDIIGLRLGMQESEIIARLATQGYAASSNGESITARTGDGQLQFALSATRAVTEIRYIFTARRASEPARLRESIWDRFGEPNQAKPPTWCGAVGRDGICLRGQSSLTFLQESLTLVLRKESHARP